MSMPDLSGVFLLKLKKKKKDENNLDDELKVYFIIRLR